MCEADALFHAQISTSSGRNVLFICVEQNVAVICTFRYHDKSEI